MDLSARITCSIFIIFIIGIQRIYSAKSKDIDIKEMSNPAKIESNPLATLILDRNEMEVVNHRRLVEPLSRVKRQYEYDPYYRRNRPIPILIGGGFGIGAGGWGFGRGFGGRGFGGRGFGGRGFGGRGFGGRGIGGRGIGGRGIGGRGVGGGGRGGGRG